jgi:hypothetical protein
LDPGKLLGTITAALVAMACVPIAAPAQTVGEIPFVDAVDAWADGQSLRRTLPGSGAGAFSKPSKSKLGRRPRKPTARQLAALRFKRTKAITQQSHQAVMERLGPGYDPAAVVAEFDRLTALVHAGMRDWKGRWSPGNIADVAAYMLLNGYGAFHARTSAPDTPILAVQSAARRSMALSRQIRGLSAARKQTAAEMLELRTILRISDLNLARTAGDAPREQAAKAALRSWIKDVFGVDLERVRLTRAGLVKRAAPPD